MQNIVIGAGPAGLAAAYVAARGGMKVTVFEQDETVGGISRTVSRNGFRFDLGGHRFFSKSRELNEFITDLLGDELVRVGRQSRIYFRGRYFDYPLQPRNAVFGLGVTTAGNILSSYLWEKGKGLLARPRIETLEDWVCNKFGRKMFELYFKSYTEKVWGIPCNRIAAEWVAQRIKGMSLTRAVRAALPPNKSPEAATLIREFTYPRLGIGRISERMAEILMRGNEVRLSTPVIRVLRDEQRITGVVVQDPAGGEKVYEADRFVSTMPITQLVRSLRPGPPDAVLKAAFQLQYRDFIAVTLMLDVERVTEDTWLYIHEPNIPFGRIHEPKNWSRAMAPEGKTSLVAEYFCFKSDPVWSMDDQQLASLTTDELVNKLGFITERDVIDYQVVRVSRAYPMYHIGYRRHLDTIISYLRTFGNLQFIGRNGAFRYNNMDHSLEMGIRAGRNLLGGKQDVLEVNSSNEYLEEVRS